MATRGKPFQPGNKFGRGRPPGRLNKRTAIAQQLLDSHADPVVRKAIVLALQGHPVALRIVMERLVPIRREAPVNIGSLPTATIAEVSKASEALLKKVASGKLTITEAHGIADLLEGRRKVVETEDLALRLAALESQNESK